MVRMGWKMKDEGWWCWMIDSDRLRGFGNGHMDWGTDICDCRVAFATENENFLLKWYDILIAPSKPC